MHTSIWKRLGTSFMIWHNSKKDPAYQQDHVMQVYQVEIDKIIRTFGVSEYSNGVYGFYLLKY